MRRYLPVVAALAAMVAVAMVLPVSSAPVEPVHYTVEAGDTYRSIAGKFGVSATALACANATGSTCPSTGSTLAAGRIIHIPPASAPTTTTQASTTTVAATTTVPATTTTVAATTTTTSSTTTTSTTLPSGAAFSEDFGSATALSGFDHGWSGEWNAGALFGDSANDWMGDHDMTCGNPNLTMRTIHLTSQAQANDAAFYPCTFDGDPAKSHMMTSVNTEGYVTVWFSPKQTFTNVTRVCWDQNSTDLGGGKWTAVQFLTSSEYLGQTDLGYTTPDFPDNGGPSSPQSAAANGVKVFRGGMDSYTGGVFRGGPQGVTVSDKAARYRHCVADNGNGTLNLSVVQPDGSTVGQTVVGNIPDGAIRVVWIDDSYNPDKHFDAAGVPRNSSMLYTWHWDNLFISTN